MARWKLSTPHYINVPGTEWEYQEADRITGRQKRTKFAVPQLLDPRDPGCWTHRWGPQGAEDGEIVVCYEGRGEPKDCVFTGDPSPDMIPVDDEAKAISAKFEKKWNFNPATDEPASFATTMIDRFQSELDEVKAKADAAQASGMGDLLATMNAMMKQNAELIAALANRPTERRV